MRSKRTFNLAVQGYANMKALEEIRPISCYFITIAETGERKSTSDKQALKSIIEYQNYLRKEYGNKLQEYKSKSRIWEQKEREILKSKSPIPIAERLARLGRPPIKPIKPLIIFPECTYEGLCKYMLKSKASIGMFSSEGGQFLGGYAMKEENKIISAAGLSSIWDRNKN